MQNGITTWMVSVALVLTAGGCACPKVKKPSSDSTPPVITWKVRNQTTNTVQNFTGDASIQAKWGEKYVVTMTASDTGGVHQASLSANSGWTCKSGSIAKAPGPGLGTPKIEKHDQWPSGDVCGEIEMFEELDFHFDCPSGFQFTLGLVTLKGTGENFYSGKTTGELDITVVP